MTSRAMASSSTASMFGAVTSNQRQARGSPSYDTPSDDEVSPPPDDPSASPSDRGSTYGDDDDDDNPRPLNALPPSLANMEGIVVGPSSAAIAGTSDEPKVPQRTAQACNPCRRSKTKCQGSIAGGSCQNCINKRKTCVFDAKPSGDRAAEHRKRQQQNENVRSIVGERQWTRIEQGENPDSVLAYGTGRLAGRVSGGGVNFLEDMDRICHDTPKDNMFHAQEPFRTILLRHSADASIVDLANWDWRSGHLMPRPSFADNERGPAWIPERKICEQLIEVFFHRHHPLMPLFIPFQFMEWFDSLWLTNGSQDRAPKSWFPLDGIPTPPATSAGPSVPGRTFMENQRLQFIPILFAVLACAEATLSRDQEALRDGSEYFRHAMINLHFVERVQAPTDGLPQLWRIQTLALLSSHLAGLHHLAGAWNLACLAAHDVKLRELSDPSKCGQGSDAQVRRRAFWCVFNLDSMLSRMLSVQPNFTLAVTHSGLPEALDPDSEEWNAFFVDHQEPTIGVSRTPTLAAGFALLCEANLLAMESVKELYPELRDRSEDWKSPETRTDLTLKIEAFERRLDELRSKVDGFTLLGGREESVTVLNLALKDLFAEVGLLLRRVQLPRQGPKTTWDRAQSPLRPSLDIAINTLTNVPSRALVPTSVYLAHSIYTIFCTALPLVHGRIRVNSPTAAFAEMDAAHVDGYLANAMALLSKLQPVFDGATVYGEAIRELRELSISWGERKNPGLKVKISTKGASSVKKPSSTSTSSSSTSGQVPKIEPLSPEVPMQIDAANGLASPLSLAPGQSHRPKTSPYARPPSAGPSKGKGRPGSMSQVPPSAYPKGPTKRQSWTNGAGGPPVGQMQASRPRARTMSSTNSLAHALGGSTIDPQQLEHSHPSSMGYYQSDVHRYLDGPATSYMPRPDSHGSPYSTGGYSPTTPASHLQGPDPHVAGPDQWDGRRYSHDSTEPVYDQPPTSYFAPRRLTYGSTGGPSPRQTYSGVAPNTYSSAHVYEPYVDQPREYQLSQPVRQTQMDPKAMVGSAPKQHLSSTRPPWEQAPSSSPYSSHLVDQGGMSSFGGGFQPYDHGSHQLSHPSSASSSSLGPGGLPLPTYPPQHPQPPQYSYLGPPKHAPISRSSSRGTTRAALGVSYNHSTRDRYDGEGSIGMDVQMDGNSPAEWDRGTSR